MTILSRRFKIEYNDATESTTVIAETGQDTGASKINRHVQIRRENDPDILKLWLEGTNFGEAIPTRKSQFGQAQNETDEPEILYKQYNPDTDSFVTQGRYYAKNTGTINENGELALKLYSFMKYTGRQSVNTGTTNTNIEDALNDVLPQGYTADVPAGATIPSVDGYTINARREKAYHELTRDYKWSMTFTGELDGNNNYLVKFEPEGFGGTVDTIIENTQAGRLGIVAVDTTNEIFTVSGDRTNELVVNQEIQVINSTENDGTYTINNLSYDSGNNTTDITVDEDVTNSTADGAIIPGGQAVFKSWEKDKTDSIINKVTVEGTSKSTGETITETATNDTQIQNFGEKFRKVKRGYIESAQDAQNIAEGYLVPGLDENGDDITKVPESGTVKTTVYSDNIVNDSIQVVGNKRNIDDTYTVVQQRNFWPEGATELEFEFEQENLEEAARDAENLRDERGRLYPSQQTDEEVGQQDFTGDTGSAPSDTAKDGGVEFERQPQQPGKALAPIQAGEGTDTITLTFDVPFVNETSNKVFDGLVFNICYSNYLYFDNGSQNGDINWDVVITNLNTGDQVFSQNSISTDEGQTSNVDGFLDTLDVDQGDTLEFQFTSVTGFSSVDSQPFISMFNVEMDSVTTHLHDDDIETDDFDHGGSGDDTGQHGTSGTTDSKTATIESTTEDKTDR